MEDPDDKYLNFCIWLLITFLLATGFCYGWIAREMWEGIHEPKEIIYQYQFYDIFYGSWEAPNYREEEVEAILSAYNPVREQCDDDPEITASGKKAEEGIAANNCLEFGTLIEYDGRTYEVQDRMSNKYGCDHFDLLMLDLEEAKSFGRKVEKIKVIILN